MKNGEYLPYISHWKGPFMELEEVIYKWYPSWLYRFCNSQMPLFQEWSVE